ncbi:cytosolic iron-sulfur assembly component 2B isoform X1 [Gambusia affinis]|uniref:cytosolic iron-sulfur assembly component 2B isoform X1 n=1 Tax=Gambusia affinis TaxID=33528 RepID=UPI001CDBEAB3|nr:cytosolic iron-sulfur assembly component 2B isoform X1 [Gambusia affinis]
MSGGVQLENANPVIFQRSGDRMLTASEEDEDVHDPIDDREIFDLIRSINDPEHPLSLEELNVVEQVRVKVDDTESTVGVEFTPTIPHCSMATLIGLSIKVKLLRSLPDRFKIDVHITPGTHASEEAGRNMQSTSNVWTCSEQTAGGQRESGSSFGELVSVGSRQPVLVQQDHLNILDCTILFLRFPSDRVCLSVVAHKQPERLPIRSLSPSWQTFTSDVSSVAHFKIYFLFNPKFLCTSFVVVCI